MLVWKWLNAKRLRDYPRLIFIACWMVLLLNFILHRGWVGGLSGIMIGGDFISNYSGGVIYSTNIQHLYDLAFQQENQAELIKPYESPGFAPFISPPYVGLAMSWVAHIPLLYALGIWEIINLISLVLSVYLISKYLLPTFITVKDLPPYQLLIIVLSSFASVVGFLAGQSHGIILLLCTGILLAMMKEKWFIAGVLGGILTYKPQFVLGFIICWLVWRSTKALLGLGLFTILWQIPILVTHGITPYMDYLAFSKSLLYLPYAKDSFPISIMATPYALLTTLLPINYATIAQYLLAIIAVGMTVLLAYIAFKERELAPTQRIFAYSMAIIFPLIIAPHTLIYDLLILVPALALLLNISGLTQPLKLVAVIFYSSLLLLPLVGYALKLALPALIPVSLLIYVLLIYFRPKMYAQLSR